MPPSMAYRPCMNANSLLGEKGYVRPCFPSP